MQQSGEPLLALVMFSPGVGIPVMAALKAGLGTRLAGAPAAAVIDHFGLLGVVRPEIAWTRAIGDCMMAVGVYLAGKAPA